MNAPGLIQKMSGPLPPANAVVSLVPEYCSGGKVSSTTWMLGLALFQRLIASLMTGSSFSATNFQKYSVVLPPPPPPLKLPPQAARKALRLVMAAPVVRARPVKARRVRPPWAASVLRSSCVISLLRAGTGSGDGRARDVARPTGVVEDGGDAERSAHRDQVVGLVAVDGVDVVGGVAREDRLRRGVQARERVRPLPGRLAHQALVGLVVEAQQLARQDGHPVLVALAGQPRERRPPRSGEVLHRRAAGREEEHLRVEVHVGHVALGVRAGRREVGGVL